MFVVEWQNTVVEHVSRCDGRFGGIKLGMRDLGIRIDIGLLIDTPYALQGADVKRVLRAKNLDGRPRSRRRLQKFPSYLKDLFTIAFLF